MTLALGMGLSSLFARLSGAQLALKTVGVLYVLFLASKIATSTNTEGEDENQLDYKVYLKSNLCIKGLSITLLFLLLL